MREFLFAVGSFSEGMTHFNRIKNFIDEVEPVTVMGSLYCLASGYPVFSLRGSMPVEGSLLRLKSSDTLWSILDELHGVHPSEASQGLHTRETVRVQRADSIEDVQAYSVNLEKLPSSARLLKSDWCSWVSDHPPLPERLTAQQRSYVRRLGLSSGREIVPIDLALYRELMKLELIVDKGRRLALSALGKEVYRYLE